MKNFKLTEEQFILLTANSLTLKNNYIREMNKAEHQELKDFYQKEIDRINELFDSLNFKFKTDF
jgi:DNA-directed RNA polymerase specialized sigma54-like protein